MDRRLGLKIAFLILIALVVLAGGCGPTVQKAEKPAADWSRGVMIGEDAVGSLGIAVEGAGERVHLVWPVATDAGQHVRYLQLGPTGERVASQDLDFPGQIKAPRVLTAENGKLHLFWSNRPPKEKWQLWRVTLLADGKLADEARQLSVPDENVGNYTVAGDGHGGAFILWDHGKPGEIRYLHLDGSGQVVAGPSVVTTEGSVPSIFVDGTGRAHLAWREGNRFLYAQIEGDQWDTAEFAPVADVTVSMGDSLIGPAVGYADGWVYVLWSILSQSGLEAGTAHTDCVAFRADNPSAPGLASRLLIKPQEEQPYEAYSGGLSLSELIAPASAPRESSDFILNPSIMVGQGDQLAVALAVSQQYRLDTHLQIATAIFSEGQFVGYSFASKTKRISDDPVLAADAGGALHVAWREGAAGRVVYYATTAPQAMANLDRLGMGDIFNAILQGGMESFVSVAFMPFVGFGWIMPGFLLMGIWKLFKDRENIAEPATWIPLGIALAIFHTIKFISLPTMVTYVPFSAWLHIPAGVGSALRLGVPPLIIAISIYVALRVRTRYSPSAVIFYISMTVTDAILTLAIYGVNFLGVY